MKDPNERNDPPRPFMEHLYALRDSVLGMAASWVICVIMAGVFSPQINKWIFGPAETCIGISMARPISCPKCDRPYQASDKVNYCLDCGTLLRPEAAVDAVPRKATCVYCETKYMEPNIPNFCGVCGREIPRDPGAKGAGEAGKEKAAASAAGRGSVRRVSIEGLDLTSGFDAILMIALWGGTALSFPFVSFYLLKFIFPALTRREKNSILFCLGAGTLFFAVGAWMAYAKTLPVVVKVFLAFADWVNTVYTVKADGYIRIVLKTILAFGIALQLPLLVFVLGWLGVISSATLRRYRKIAIVIIFVLGMVLTPPDPMSQIIMAVPMILLYELSIWLIRLREVASGRKVE